MIKGDPNHVVDQHQPEARKHLSGEGITRASPAGFILLQNTLLNQLSDVAQRSIRRAFLDQRPFTRGQLAFEPVQQAIENIALPVVDFGDGVLLPKLGLFENRRKNGFEAVECAIQTSQEPFKPRRNIEPALLRAFKHVVIAGLWADVRLCSCPKRVIRVVLTVRRLLPVYPDNRTYSVSFGMSQTCRVAHVGRRTSHWTST